MSKHKSGFVNIIGRPNAGKSTLMNQLLGEKMSIITHKPQTTRQRILGILSEDNYQIVFSDTPGYIKEPGYKMQSKMNKYVAESFDDADVVLFMVDINDRFDGSDPLLQSIKKTKVPVYLLLNKIDMVKKEIVLKKLQQWSNAINFKEFYPISALNGINVEDMIKNVVRDLPEGPAYYPKDQLTDKPMRFFVSEIIREKILEQYAQEIPYSCEVVVESYKKRENKNFIDITAMIYVSRQTQKSIIIGKGGKAIQKLGTEARLDIEKFIDSRIFLELRVKVKDSWRDDDRLLKQFGY